MFACMVSVVKALNKDDVFLDKKKEEAAAEEQKEE
jgi:hypothetical protein